jgi:hypothetical protein
VPALLLSGAKLSTNINLHRDEAQGRNFEMMEVFGFLSSEGLLSRA